MNATQDILQAARQEEERLLDELRPFPQFRKLEAVRALIATYLEGSPPKPLQAAPANATQKRRSSIPLSAAVVHAARMYLEAAARRAESAEIAEAVQRAGVEIDSSRGASIVSSYLSQSPVFDNVRGQGYGLSEWSKKEATGNGHPKPEVPEQEAAPAF